MCDKEFTDMTLNERIGVVDNRFGGSHPDRITQPSELFNYIGETIYFVISPFGQEQNVGNATMYEWFVDRIIDRTGTVIDDASQIVLDDDQKYMCIDETSEFKALSIKDFNIIPNTYNNHAAFSTKEGAEAYIMFRKLQWTEDSNLTELAEEYDFWINEQQIKKTQEKG